MIHGKREERKKAREGMALRPWGLPVCLAFALGAHAGDTLRVGGQGTHSSIASALRDAGEGDFVIVSPGEYREAGLTVDKAVSLRGEGWPVLDAEGGGTILNIRADGVVVNGLVFRNVGVNHLIENAGVWISGARGVRIEGNRFERVFFGVYGSEAREAVVKGNRFDGLRSMELANGNGIHFWKSESATIEDNAIRGHRDGIYLEFTGGTSVTGNICEENVRYGLHFMYSNGNAYRGNAFRNNGAGVAVMYSRDVDMRDNVFERNWGPASYGLLLKSLRDSRVENNRFDRNTVAVFQEGSSGLTFSGNRFRRNGWALRIVADSDRNLFAGNRFEGNTFDVAYNASPGNTNAFRGNLWDRYAGWDLDRDGTGDVPHRPVELFPAIMQNHPQAMALLRSHFATLLNLLERLFPTLSPATLEDTAPLMPATNTGRRTA